VTRLESWLFWREPREVEVLRRLLLLPVLAGAGLAAAQTPMNMGGAAASFTENVARHTGAGTDLEPASSAAPMLMRMQPSGWMLMLHGEAMIAEQQQTGLRGRDKLFSVNWLMPMAQRNFEHSQLTLRAMFSLEPATITGRYYPELFQEGETAFGKPIVDGQHPHDLFMEIATLYDVKAGAHTLLSIYAAPVGDPALGPEAYPHRLSIGDDPLAPLGHHLQDSTHIADDVATGGLSWGGGQNGLRVEASGFHGREPDENRWHIAVGAVDSWSARISAAPYKDLAVQYSLGHLHSPEQAHPGEDVLRQTASIAWHRKFGTAAIDALAAWGRNHTDGSSIDANGYLLEAALRDRDRQTVWTRIENVDRTTDLLGAAAPPIESVVGRVQAYTGGYAHSIWSNSSSSYEIGAQATVYGAPPRLRADYGDHPFGAAAEIVLRLGRIRGQDNPHGE
jgi:hypothetical protein